MVNKSYLKKAISDSIFQCLFTSISFFLIGPVNLFVSNSDEFGFFLTDILPMLLMCTLGAYLVLQLICCLIKKRKMRSVVTAIILGIGIGFYVQSNFMSSGYGQLNGEAIDWNSMIGRGVFNTVVWCVCIAVPVVIALRAQKGKRFQVQKLASQVMLAFLTLTLVIYVVTSGVLTPDKNDEFTVSTEDAFTLSDEKNVVVFLLDDFSSVLFEEIMNENDVYQEKFSGFTYFPDTTGVGCTTKGSLPYILTGMWNENTMKYGDYLNAGYDNELYNLLQDMEYDSRIFVAKKYVGNQSVDLFDNMYREKENVSEIQAAKLMYKLTAFTNMPHFLKPAFWLYSGEFNTAIGSNNTYSLSTDPNFYKSLVENEITVNEDYNGTYRFYYLNGAHSPFDMNEEAEAVESGSVTRKQRAMGALKIVYTYLDQLRENGLYDNTMVIVLADHGDWEDSVVFNPMLLVKPLDSKVEGLQVSNAQITYEDLMPTILEEITGEDKGMTVFEVPEDMMRERRFMYYSWDGDWEADYLPTMYEYRIYGNVRDMGSRRSTGRIFTDEGIIIQKTEYTLGNQIIYTKEYEENQTFVDYGLYVFEDTHTFTKPYVLWRFPLSEYNGSDLKFTLQVVALRGESQRVRLSVNGEFLEEVTVYSGGDLAFEIPARLIGDDNEVLIELEFPDASATESDVRIRALAIRSVVLDYIMESEYELGTVISYRGEDSVEETFAYMGLHTPEKKHTFTKDNVTKWLFPLTNYEGGSLKFDLNYTSVTNGSQRIRVTVNDEFLEELTVTSLGVTSITIPENLITENQVKIALEFPDASATESDGRVRALALSSVVLYAAEKDVSGVQ